MRGNPVLEPFSVLVFWSVEDSSFILQLIEILLISSSTLFI